MAENVEAHVAVRQVLRYRRLTRIAPCALQDRLHARDQFARAKRLDDVIAAAYFQTDHAIALIGARREKQNRQIRSLTNLAENRQAVHFRHGDVEYDKGRFDSLKHFQRIKPALIILDITMPEMDGL